MSVDIFEFEDLIADMLGITDDERENDECVVEERFYDKFEIDFEQGFEFAKALLPHIPPVGASLSEKVFHAFTSKDGTAMLMREERK